MPRKYPEAFRARAVRMVRDRIEQEEGVSRYRAVREIAPKLGVSSAALQRWVEQADIDAGTQPGVASDAAEIKRLRRENAELRRVNEILKTASAF
ncbi:transposase, partial [Arachnia propionica]